MSQFAYHLRNDGAHQAIDLANLSLAPVEGGFLWVNLDPQDEVGKDILFNRIELDVPLREAMANNTLRPRLEVGEDFIFLSLRGVNMSESECLEDMVNLRILILPHLILTLHTRELVTINTMRDLVDKNQVFSAPSSCAIRMIATITDLIATELELLGDEVTDLEEISLTLDIVDHQEEISTIRRTLIGLQKYMIPQANVLHRLYDVDSKWFKKRERTQLKNLAEKLSTQVDELEHLRQRTNVLQEEVKSALSEKMGNTMYRLTIVSTIMLPLGLFAGLMGANVGGMPFADSPFGFIVLCLVSVALGAAVYGALKWLKWI